MKVLVDTSVWSLALRRRRSDLARAERACVFVLRDLITQDLTLLVGVVRQELLSGIADPASFERLREYLRDFEDHPLIVEDFEEAARCRNLCAAGGVAASAPDMLLCAQAIRLGVSVFTTDADFRRYAAQLPLRLPTLRQLQIMLRKLKASGPDDLE